MKKQGIILVGVFIITCILIFITMFYAPYYIHDDGNYITLIEEDMDVYAMFIIVIIFTILTVVFYVVAPKIKADIFEFRLPNYVAHMLPLPPLIILIMPYLFDMLQMRTSSITYFFLGSHFVIAHHTLYPDPMEFSEIVDVGKSLQYGFGMYIMWGFLVVLIIEYVCYYRFIHKRIGNPIA